MTSEFSVIADFAGPFADRARGLERTFAYADVMGGRRRRGWCGQLRGIDGHKAAPVVAIRSIDVYSLLRTTTHDYCRAIGLGQHATVGRIRRLNVVIASVAQPKRSVLIESNELKFDRENASFWMRLVMGDDWLQRVKSSLGFAPISFELLRDGEARVLFETAAQAHEFEAWLILANERVDHGFRTMNG